jgi:F-type H+-transporting ATPase subunit a
MVIIERIRNFIRPLTLSIRLSANIIAGHLLITLIGNQISTIESSSGIFFVLQLFLIVLEMAVAVIQSYVFTILMTIYIRELNYDNKKKAA